MTVLFDSVTASDIPTDATMVAGYLDGRYQSYWDLAALFPNAVRISITVQGGDADVLDVESGDATPGEAPAWVVAMREQGADPTVYVSRLGTWPATLTAMTEANVPEPNWWVADQTGEAHLVPGSVATQWVNAGPYDVSETNGTWMQPTPPPAPTPPAPPKENEVPVSAAFQWNEKYNAIQVSDGVVWHKFDIGTSAVTNESILTKANISGVSFPDQTPQVAIIGTQLTVMVEDSGGNAWYFVQQENGTSWSAQKLP